MRVLAAPSLLLTLTACGFDQFEAPLVDDTASNGDADVDSDGDSDADSDKDPIEIASVTPNYVTTKGGQALTIIGGPFDSSATIRFDGTAGLVDDAQTNVMSVYTPALPGAGSYDIEVTTDKGYGSRKDALIVLEDGTGLAGTFGELSWEQYVGGYWSSGSPPASEGWASMGFLVPVSFSYWEFYAPSMGSCGNDYVYAGAANILEMGATNAKLSNGSTTISMKWDDTRGQYCSGSSCDPNANIGTVSSSQWRSGSTYQLDAFVPTTGYPSFTVPNFVRTPTGLNVTNPAVTGSTLPYLSSNQTFNWSGTDADYVLITLWVLDASQANIDKVISCAAPNTGNFTMPSSAWGGFVTDRVTHVRIGAVKETTGTLPSGARTQMVGINWIHGGGYTY